jgi:DNA polymerase-3 subunit delta'
MKIMWKIIGHQHILAFFAAVQNSGQPRHAYLLSGPSQVGKRTLLRAFAQALVCQADSPRQDGPCGQCIACRKVQHGTSPDVSSVLPAEGKKTIGIDEIRQLLRDAALQPQESRYRIFLLPDCELMTIESANALLKTLEEPPQRTILLLSTNNEAAVPSTILSRCQVLPVGLVASAEIKAALIADWGQSEEQARILSILAAGRPGWAINASQDEALREQRLAWINALVRLCSSGVAQRLAEAAKLAQDREHLEALLETWLLWWREVLLVAEGRPPSGLLADEYAPLARQSGGSAARAAIAAIQMALEQLEQNAPARMVLETLVLEFPAIPLQRTRP